MNNDLKKYDKSLLTKDVLRAGYAKIIITPPIGSELCGYVWIPGSVLLSSKHDLALVAEAINKVARLIE